MAGISTTQMWQQAQNQYQQQKGLLGYQNNDLAIGLRVNQEPPFTLQSWANSPYDRQPNEEPKPVIDYLAITRDCAD